MYTCLHYIPINCHHTFLFFFDYLKFLNNLYLNFRAFWSDVYSCMYTLLDWYSSNLWSTFQATFRMCSQILMINLHDMVSSWFGNNFSIFNFFLKNLLLFFQIWGSFGVWVYSFIKFGNFQPLIVQIVFFPTHFSCSGISITLFWNYPAAHRSCAYFLKFSLCAFLFGSY